jgi:hypothetical protein
MERLSNHERHERHEKKLSFFLFVLFVIFVVHGFGLGNISEGRDRMHRILRCCLGEIMQEIDSTEMTVVLLERRNPVHPVHPCSFESRNVRFAPSVGTC